MRYKIIEKKVRVNTMIADSVIESKFILSVKRNRKCDWYIIPDVTYFDSEQDARDYFNKHVDYKKETVVYDSSSWLEKIMDILLITCL